MAENTKVVKAGIGYVIGNYLLKGLNFLMVPVFSRLMSTADYGIYNTFTAYEAILYILMGYAIHSSYKNALYKFGTVENGVERGKDYHTYVSSTIVLLLVSAVVWFAAFFLLSGNLTEWLGLDYPSLLLLLIYSFSGAILACYNAHVGLKYQYKNFLTVAAFNAVSSIGLSILLMFTAFPEHRYMARMIGTTVPIAMIAVFVIFKFLRKSKPGNYKPFLSWGLKYSLPVVFHGISQVVLAQFDRIMITRMIDAASTGIYSFAYNIYGIINVTALSLDNVWNPWMYEQMAAKRYDNIKKKSSLYILLMMLFSVGVMLISPELVKLLGDREYWSASYSVIPIVAGGFFAFLYTIPASVEFYYEKTKFVAMGTFAAAVINIALNYIFMKQFGYIAAAYTTLFTYILYFVFHYLIARKIHGSCLFSTKIIVGGSALVLAVAGLSLLLMDLVVVRWILAVGAAVLLVVTEERKIGFSKKILKKFRRK